MNGTQRCGRQRIGAIWAVTPCRRAFGPSLNYLPERRYFVPAICAFGGGDMTARREMTHLMATEAEAQTAMQGRLEAMRTYPPMWPITDIRVERRQIGRGPDGIRWVVVGNYSAWPNGN
jgi:hypothetical protein